MGVGKLDYLNCDGRVHGHYLYMLLCQDGMDAPIYIKIGETANPLTRFRTLRSGCPVAPKSFAYFDARTRTAARRIEAQLHLACHEWNAHLEWFRFVKGDKARFNEVLSRVLGVEMGGKPVIWNRLSVPELIKMGDRNQSYKRLLFGTRNKEPK
jgi:T5orf172 domain